MDDYGVNGPIRQMVTVVGGGGGATAYPSTGTPSTTSNRYIGTGTATNTDSTLFGAKRVTLLGYLIDVAAAGRIVCVAHDGTEIPGTGLTIGASAAGQHQTFGGGITWAPPTNLYGTGAGANVGIKAAAGITVTLIFIG